MKMAGSHFVKYRIPTIYRVFSCQNLTIKRLSMVGYEPMLSSVFSPFFSEGNMKTAVIHNMKYRLPTTVTVCRVIFSCFQQPNGTIVNPWRVLWTRMGTVTFPCAFFRERIWNLHACSGNMHTVVQVCSGNMWTIIVFREHAWVVGKHNQWDICKLWSILLDV
jgi:hypothetical protein